MISWLVVHYLKWSICLINKSFLAFDILYCRGRYHCLAPFWLVAWYCCLKLSKVYYVITESASFKQCGRILTKSNSYFWCYKNNQIFAAKHVFICSKWKLYKIVLGFQNCDWISTQMEEFCKILSRATTVILRKIIHYYETQWLRILLALEQTEVCWTSAQYYTYQP